MAYTKTEDAYGRQVRPLVGNESEDGSGTWHLIVTDSSGYPKVSLQAVADDALFKLGTDADIVLLNRSTILAADTALTNVLIGTPESQALAANSLMISNVTASGDLAWYVNKGGNSQMVFWADGSTGDTSILAASGQSVDILVAGTKEYDFSATLFDMSTNNLYSGGVLFVGNSNTTAGSLTTGIQIDQGAADDAIFIGKSSDVAHGGDGTRDTDTWIAITKADGIAGGAAIYGLKDSGGTAGYALSFYGKLAENADTTKSTAGVGIYVFHAQQISGDAAADMAADGNSYVWRSRVGSAWVTGMILDEDGDIWANGGITTGGATVLNYVQNLFSGDFISGGGTSYAMKNYYSGEILGFSGDTSWLSATYFGNSIKTQTSTESISFVAQVAIGDPSITDQLGGAGVIGIASSLYISGAPTEGTVNTSIYVVNGDTRFYGTGAGSVGGIMYVGQHSPSPAVDDRVGWLIGRGRTADLTEETMGYMVFRCKDTTNAAETGQIEFNAQLGGTDTLMLTLNPSTGALLSAGDIKIGDSVDSATEADQVALGGYEIGAGNRVLAISQETAVAVDTDETKFSHKMQVRLNGATYFMMLTQT